MASGGNDWGEWSVHARLTITSPNQEEARCSLTLVGPGLTPPTSTPGNGRVRRDAACQTTSSYHNNYTTNDETSKVREGEVRGRKNPRTVHIDVYCTATSSDEEGVEDSIGGENNEGRTVFEDERLRVVHQGRGGGRLPQGLRREKRVPIAPPPPHPPPPLPPSSPGSTSWKDTSLESLIREDSFDYENSSDKLRIKEKERGAWRGGIPHSTIPLNHHEEEDDDNDTSSAEDTTTSSSSGTELAWSFGRYEELEGRGKGSSINVGGVGLRREGTVLRAPPSHIPRTSPIASKFGPVVTSLRRPGHHVGPSKNPDCSCQTCRFHFGKPNHS